MEKYSVTIGRQYGSGGRLVGKLLAEELGVAFYDKELIALTAQKSGLAEEVIEQAEYEKPNSLLYSMYMTSQTLPVNDRVFIAQAQIIKDIAQTESCVIVGRCADYALRDMENCYRVFIHAPMEERVRRVQQEYGMNNPKLEAFIRKEDKKRAAYYSHFTQLKWGDAQHYHLSIDSSIGINKSVALIKELIRSE